MIAEMVAFGLRIWKLAFHFVVCFFPTLAVVLLCAAVFKAPQVPEIVADLHQTATSLGSFHTDAGAVGRLLITIAAIIYAAACIGIAAIATIGPDEHATSTVASTLAALTILSAAGVFVAPAYALWCVVAYILIVLLVNAFDLTTLPVHSAAGTNYILIGLILAVMGLAVEAAAFFDNVDFPRAVNAFPMIYIGIGWWTLVWTLLVVTLCKRIGVDPRLSAVVVVGLIAACSTHNDDHQLETTLNPLPVVGTSDTFQAYVDSWLRQHCKPDRPCKVTFVAAQGGGQRALYWTAATLERLHADDSTFDNSLFAFSGVSGGAIGGLTYFISRREIEAGLLSDSRPPPSSGNPLPTSPAAGAVNMFASADNLAPVISAMFSHEALQALWPAGINGLDRARIFDKALESSWAGAMPSSAPNLMASPFPETLPSSAPLIFLNSTMVDTGARVVNASHIFAASPLPAFPFQSLAAAVPLAQAMKTSTAGQLSGRFPWVNPYATIDDGNNQYWGRLLDGGMNEGTGLATVLDVLTAFEAAVRTCQCNVHHLESRIIYISNDPASDEALDGTAIQTDVVSSPTPTPVANAKNLSVVASPSPSVPHREFLWELLAPVTAEFQQDASTKDEALRDRIAAFINRPLPAFRGPHPSSTEPQPGFTGLDAIDPRADATSIAKLEGTSKRDVFDDIVTVETISLERMRVAYNSGRLSNIMPTPGPTWCAQYANWNPELGWWLSDRSHTFMDTLLNTSATYISDDHKPVTGPILMMSDDELRHANNPHPEMTACPTDPP